MTRSLFIGFLLTGVHLALGQNVHFTYNPQQVCAPATISFTNTSTVGTHYYWKFGDGSHYIGQDTAHTYTSGGSIKVFLYAFDVQWNLVESNYQDVEIFKSSGDFLISDSVACPGELLKISSEDHLSFWQWEISDGSTYTSKNFFHSFPDTGLYHIRLIGGQGLCDPDTIDKMVLVTDTFDLDPFTLEGSALVCPGEPAGFMMEPFLLELNDHIWSFGDGNQDTAIFGYASHEYDSAGVYEVRVSFFNRCRWDTFSTTITVTEYIEPSFWIQVNSSTYCPGEPVDFSIGMLGNLLKDITWFFGDGKELSGSYYPEHYYWSPGNYNVMCIGTNYCGLKDTATITIPVTNNKVTAPAFNINPSSGTIYQPIQFRTYGQHPQSLIWDFGDGNTQNFNEQPIHYYTQNGNYPVKLIMTNQCGNTGFTTEYITISPPPVLTANAWILISQDPVCVGAKAGFRALFPNATDIRWDFGDGSQDSGKGSVTHTYANTGIYTVTLVVRDPFGQVDVDTKEINVVDNIPVYGPNIYINNQYSGEEYCPGELLKIQVSDSSIYKLSWDLGDGYTDTAHTLLYHSYPDTGNYTIRLIVENECGQKDTSIRQIRIVEGAMPNMDYRIGGYKYPETQACPGESLIFEYWGGNALAYWDLGDGTLDSANGPIKHVYCSTGIYDVKMMVTNVCGISDTLDLTVSVNPCSRSGPGFEVDPPYVCQSDSIRFIPNDQRKLIRWDFGDGHFDTVREVTRHAYSSIGQYKVSYISQGDCGFIDTSYTYALVTTKGEATAMISLEQDTVFVNKATRFNNLSNTTWKALWHFGNGDSSLDIHPIYAYSDTGTYEVCLEVMNSCGAAADTSATITVIPSPDISGRVFLDDTTLVVGKGSIVILPYREEGYMPAHDTVPINPDGSYHISGLPPGDYLLWAMPDTGIYPSVFPAYWHSEPYWHQADTIGINSSETGLDLITLNQDAPEGFQPITGKLVEGTVFLDSQGSIGQPMPDRLVILYDAATGEPVDLSYADDKGIFTFDRITEGHYKCYVNLPGIPSDTLFSLPIEGSAVLKDTLLAVADSNIVWFSYLRYNGIGSSVAHFPVYVYPNPYRNHTTFEYFLEAGQSVRLSAFNALGQSTIVVDENYQRPGRYRYTFSAKDLGLSTGLYFIQLKTDQFQVVKKLVEVK